MVYTVTLNPSLDYFVTVENFTLGMTNRTSGEKILPGGKGLNVSMVLKNLGIPSKALGFAAGFVGREIMRRLEELGIENGLVEMAEGNSRINVKFTNEEGTEINGMGPVIQTGDMEKLYQTLEQMQAGDVLVLAGSIPASMPSDIYSSLCKTYTQKGVLVVVDATKQVLFNCLEYHPFLIKPNNHELGELFGVTLSNHEEVIPYAKKLQELGAKNVLVSMASKGAVFLSEDGTIYTCQAPKGIVKNAVGAGDSMVAGFLTGWLVTKEYKTAFAQGVATGSASAFSESFATKEEVEELLKNITINRI